MKRMKLSEQACLPSGFRGNVSNDDDGFLSTIVHTGWMQDGHEDILPKRRDVCRVRSERACFLSGFENNARMNR